MGLISACLIYYLFYDSDYIAMQTQVGWSWAQSGFGNIIFIELQWNKGEAPEFQLGLSSARGLFSVYTIIWPYHESLIAVNR